MSTQDGPDGGQARFVNFDDLDAESADGDVRPRVVSFDEGGIGERDATSVRVVSFDDLGADDRRPASDAAGRRAARSHSGGSSRSGARSGRRDAAVGREPSRGTGGDPDVGAGPDTGIGGVTAAGESGPTTATAGIGTGERRGGRAGRAPGKDAPQDEESRAREICLRLLTDRARTVKELSDTLRRKEISDDVARRVLERFDEVGLVDDEAFAGQWVRSRHRQNGLGRRAIAAELHRKGVAKDVADSALTEIDAESEESRARELVDRRLRSMRVETEEDRASTARRLVGMLARKGYGSGLAYGVVRGAIAARGAEEGELGESPTGD